jgi:hypothetical protein
MDAPIFKGFSFLSERNSLHRQTVPASVTDVPVLTLSDLRFATKRGQPPPERAPRLLAFLNALRRARDR